MMKINDEKSILLQLLATCTLLANLQEENFLESDFFKKMKYCDIAYKNILIESGIGNPGTMQIMIYAFLVVPKEILPRIKYEKLELTYKQDLNPLIFSLVENGTFSTYEKEEEPKNINYVKRIRNAVSHSRCKFYTENKKNYVMFTDTDKKKGITYNCEIRLECTNVGNILTKLQEPILAYLHSDD